MSGQFPAWRPDLCLLQAVRGSEHAGLGLLGRKGASRQAYWWFLPCPGQEGTGPAAAATWRENRAPDKVAGWVVCGKVYGPVHGNPEAKSIMWTRDSDLLLSIAEGPDLASLYDWWTRNR